MGVFQSNHLSSGAPVAGTWERDADGDKTRKNDKSHEVATEVVKFDLDQHLTPEYVSWLNDPETVKFSEQRHKTHTLDSCRDYVKSMDGEGILWAIIYEGEHIGNISAHIDRQNSTADISILLGKRRGEGIGVHVLSRVAAMLKNIGYDRVTCGCRADNLAMERTAGSAGFMNIGRVYKHFKTKDGREDKILYSYGDEEGFTGNFQYIVTTAAPLNITPGGLNYLNRNNVNIVKTVNMAVGVTSWKDLTLSGGRQFKIRWTTYSDGHSVPELVPK